jgi:exosortase
MSVARSIPLSAAAWLALLVVLWLQLFAACIYGWRFGDYYSYGWYVPPLVLFFFWRIRGLWKEPESKMVSTPLVVLGGAGLFTILFAIRTIQRVDPRWTLPIWIQALVVLSVTAGVFYRLGGYAALRRSIPILLFACSAIPLPTVLERLVVLNLTDSVVASSAVLLGMLGMPVKAVGDQLGLMGEVVSVTEGCSGIRSAQSFLMSSLFFGELLRLRTRSRVILLLIGLLCAWGINVVRASTLTMIRFNKGADAFDAAHDLAGLVAFIVCSALLLLVANLLESRSSKRAVITRKQERSAT